MADAISRFAELPGDFLPIISVRAFARLEAELGGVVKAFEWLVTLATERSKPLAVHLPGTEGGHTVVIAPPTWPAVRLRDWIAERRGDLEVAFGRVLSGVASARIEGEHPLILIQLAVGANHPAVDETLRRAWSRANNEQREGSFIDCDMRGPLNGPPRRQLQRLIALVSQTGATLRLMVDLPEATERRAEDAAFARSLVSPELGVVTARGPRMEILIPALANQAEPHEPPGFYHPTEEEVAETERVALPVRRVMGLISAQDLGSGRAAPIVWVDASQRPDMLDLARVHQLESPREGGDTVVGWGASFEDDQQTVIFRCLFKSPVRTRFALQFELPRHLSFLEEVARQDRFTLATGAPPSGSMGWLEHLGLSETGLSVTFGGVTAEELRAILHRWRAMFARFYGLPVEAGDAFGETIPSILSRLPDSVRMIWTDRRSRAAAIGDIVAAIAFDHRRDDLSRAVDDFDRAVEFGLAGLGLPRGPIQRPIVMEPLPLGRSGVKLPDCRIVLSTTYFRTLELLYGTLEPAFRTWVHESIHARAPYEADFLDEFENWPGYEEGLADGLAGLVCQGAGMDTVETAYGPYVRAYSALARVLDWDAWALLGQLWELPFGRVRNGLLQVAQNRWIAISDAELSMTRQENLRAAADLLFAPSQLTRNASDSALVDQWRAALQ